MSNVVSTALFCTKNFKKAEDNCDASRLIIAGSQLNSAVRNVSVFDHAIGKTAKTAVDAFESVAKHDKVVSALGKGVNFLSQHVNPIICVTSGIKVLNSDDKKSEAIKQTSALSSMFIVEHAMKKNFDNIREIKGMEKVADKFMKFAKNMKCEKTLPAIIHGIAFVAGSTLAYAAGEKFGTLAAQEINS